MTVQRYLVPVFSILILVTCLFFLYVTVKGTVYLDLHPYTNKHMSVTENETEIICQKYRDRNSILNVTFPTTCKNGEKVLANEFIGRLGNQLHHFAAIISMCASQKFVPYFPNDSKLFWIFGIPKPKLHSSCEMTYFKSQKLDVRGWPYKAWTENIFEISHITNSSILLRGSLLMWKYFCIIEGWLREHLKFNSYIQNKVKLFYKTSVPKQDGSVYVGVHIRLRDLSKRWSNKEGYLKKAVHYFINKYDNVTFIVCSNYIEEAKLLFPVPNAVYSVSNVKEPYVDLALLASCDHVIMTIGTFGFWAGFLSGGTVLYHPRNVPKGYFPPDSPQQKWINVNW